MQLSNLPLKLTTSLNLVHLQLSTPIKVLVSEGYYSEQAFASTFFPNRRNSLAGIAGDAAGD